MTGGDYTRAVVGTLRQGEADLALTYRSLRSTVATLDSQLRASLAAWDGPAQQAYYRAKGIWDTAIADMANAMNQLSDVIGAAPGGCPTSDAATGRSR